MKPFFAVALLVLLCGTCHAKKAKSSKPALKAVWSAIWCSPCHDLRDGYLKSGAPVHIYPVKGQPAQVKHFPYYEYTDGTFDNGDKLRGNKATLPSVVVFYEVIN